MAEPTPHPSTWEPLRQPLFLALWGAAIASNVGTWMQEVGQAWLMTSLAPTPLMVALLQTVESFPMFLLALPAGAVADVVDRRRLLLFTQTWMLAAATGLGVATLLKFTTPNLLLVFVGALGVGAALNMPAWQAIIPELVPRPQLPAAVTLNSAGFNIARAVGPALGGFVVAVTSPGIAFLINAASFLAVILVLYRWRRSATTSTLPAERVLGAVRAGLRYVRHAPPLRAVLMRTALFTGGASALWATLPLVARKDLGLEAIGYGVLLGCLGGGAVLATGLLPRLRRHVSSDLVVVGATMLFAAATAALAWVRVLGVLCAAMVLGGMAWMAAMSTFMVAAQVAVPAWVRARALAVYLLVFMGGMAAGSALWGAVAEQTTIPDALVAAALGLLIGLPATLRYRLENGEDLDLTPSQHWPGHSTLVTTPGAEDGPVLVMIEYRIDPKKATEFAQAMQAVRLLRRRDGAARWGLFHDMENPSRYLETFVVESWAEHLRQHERVTRADLAVEER
ncbi:MAG: MFS transporter, partial [Planctomycetes bacterium]|nr:MFS transporter [Planctomycetota bacterium]